MKLLDSLCRSVVALVVKRVMAVTNVSQRET